MTDKKQPNQTVTSPDAVRALLFAAHVGEDETAHSEILHIATGLAAKRRQMAAEVLALMMTKDAESVLTPEENREAWEEAVSQGWAIGNGDGTFTLTEAGRQLIAAFHKRSQASRRFKAVNARSTDEDWL